MSARDDHEPRVVQYVRHVIRAPRATPAAAVTRAHTATYHAQEVKRPCIVLAHLDIQVFASPQKFANFTVVQSSRLLEHACDRLCGQLSIAPVRPASRHVGADARSRQKTIGRNASSGHIKGRSLPFHLCAQTTKRGSPSSDQMTRCAASPALSAPGHTFGYPRRP